MTRNTIYALSTAFRKSAIAIIRVSGKNSIRSLEKLSQKPLTFFPPQKMVLTSIYLNNEILDKPLITYFEEGKSYTGEALVEYHIHGSLAVIKELLEFLGTCTDHRIAEMGEFTKRALENTKIDLLQAEGINDLINAETTMQRKQALREFSGEIGDVYEKWFQEIKEILAFLEATIDFSDEDIPQNLFESCKTNLNKLIEEIQKHERNGKKVQKIKNGISITITGSPNVGKSTFINYLTQEDTAIVSSIAGTTRDIIEAFLDIKGYPVRIADTAGLRQTKDPIEIEGIKRAIKKVKTADINITILDSTDIEQTFKNVRNHLQENTASNFILINKIDLISKQEELQKQLISLGLKNYYLVSLTTNKGLANFEKALIKELEIITAIEENPVVLQERHSNIIKNCLEELYLALQEFNDTILASHHIRNSLNLIGKIQGKTNIEEIIGIIFNNFCIGK